MSEERISVAHLQKIAREAKVHITIKEEKETKELDRQTEESAQKLAGSCIKSFSFTLESAAREGKYSLHVWNYITRPYERMAAEIVVQHCRGLGFKAEILYNESNDSDRLVVSWEE